MARTSTIEVAPRFGRWARHQQGLGAAAAFHRSEQEAILVAREQAKRAGADLVVRGAGGRIRHVASLRSRTAR